MKYSCKNCKYKDVDVSDFPCSECWVENEMLIRYIPKGSQDEWRIVKIGKRMNNAYELPDFCIACNAEVTPADPSRGCPVCGHVAVIRAEDLTSNLRNWYQKVMDRL